MAIVSHLLKLAALGALLAGCRAHHARLAGSVTVPEGTEFPPDVRLIYRAHDPKHPCAEWAACVKAGAWAPLRRCNGKAEDSIVVTTEDRRNRFEACATLASKDYAVDLIAFVDLDHDGTLDPGERYGAWTGNPLTREREQGSIEIAIDQALP